MNQTAVQCLGDILSHTANICATSDIQFFRRYSYIIIIIDYRYISTRTAKVNFVSNRRCRVFKSSRAAPVNV